ncbi:MAG TPA: glycerol-3-phosphate 1-O-acyltransferase PlsY [Syntrophorhabdaceae bacterium]|nr:glycerol-3-phosphate 1-O-acyltransferase PlsY [Syntrophorhabdaceae bacterium]
MLHILFVCCAYLIGSVPVGVLLARIKGKDPRKTGSGNIGATNVMRSAGKGLGIMTLFCDVLKGFLPVFIAIEQGDPHMFVALVGLAVFLGHIFPVFLKFKGGKGVATAAGVYLAIAPMTLLICFVLFVVVFLTWRYVSVGSLAGTGVMPIALFALKAPLAYCLLSVALGLCIYIKHKENIRRLFAGRENKISFSK